MSTITTYPNYYFVLDKLYLTREYMAIDFLEYCSLLFTDDIKATELWKELDLYIKREKKLTVNNVLPYFLVESNKDKMLNETEAIKTGKYTFIDFWASWCVPCRCEMQKLKKIYSSIDTSKIEIVSISIDIEKQSWLKAEKEEAIPWQSFVDVNENIRKTFNLSYIPQGIIINEKKIVVGRLVTLDELIDFLTKNRFLK